MKESMWKKQMSELTTGESVKFTVVMTAALMAACYGPLAIACNWDEICNVCGDIKNKIMGKTDEVKENEES